MQKLRLQSVSSNVSDSVIPAGIATGYRKVLLNYRLTIQMEIIVIKKSYFQNFQILSAI